MNVKDAETAILTQGYMVIPDILSKSHVRSLSEFIDKTRAEDISLFEKDYLYAIGQEGFVINVGNRGEPFEKLLREFPAKEIIDHILGPDAFLYLFQGVIVPPGGGLGAYPWKWHCDLYHVALNTNDRKFVPGLNCLFYVDDVDSRNGGTWIIPASQGYLDETIPHENEEFLDRCAFQIEAKAGSVAIFNPLLWHCAGSNNTDKARRAVKMLMIRGWMLPQMDYSRSISPDALARMNSDALRILGHRSRIPRSFEEVSERRKISSESRIADL